MIAYPLDNTLVIYGKRLKLNLTFDNVLRVMDLQKEKELEDLDKLEISLEMLVVNYRKIKKLGYKEKLEVLEKIFSTFISPPSNKPGSDEKVFDFNQDAEYIYSSFMLDYNIDLVEEQGKLDWRKFIALFQGLSENAKISQVISIRTQKIPTPNKYNQKQIEALQKAKVYYRLQLPEEEAKEQFQKGLNKLADTLIQRAVKKDAKDVKR